MLTIIGALLLVVAGYMLMIYIKNIVMFMANVMIYTSDNSRPPRSSDSLGLKLSAVLTAAGLVLILL